MSAVRAMVYARPAQSPYRVTSHMKKSSPGSPFVIHSVSTLPTAPAWLNAVITPHAHQ